MLRNSALDRHQNCPGSFTEDDALHYDEPNEMARSGTACHHGLALAVESDWADMGASGAAAADKFGTDVEDARIVIHQGRKVWSEIKDRFPHPRTEHRVTGHFSKGTSDLVNIIGQLATLDWKTGYGMVEHPNQLLGYADGLYREYGMPDSGYIYGVEVWVRFGTYREYFFSEERLLQFADEVKDAATRKSFSAGPWCTYCPRFTNCDARTQLAQSTIDILNPARGTVQLTPEDIGAVWEQRGIVKKAVDDLEKLAKTLLSEGVEIPLPDGRKLGFIEQTRRKFDAAKTYEILTGEAFDLTHDAAMGALGASAKAIGEVVGSMAAKGEKAKDKSRAMKLIGSIGGIETKTSLRTSILDAGES